MRWDLRNPQLAADDEGREVAAGVEEMRRLLENYPAEIFDRVLRSGWPIPVSRPTNRARKTSDTGRRPAAV